jgi:hypothetical protein
MVISGHWLYPTKDKAKKGLFAKDRYNPSQEVLMIKKERTQQKNFGQ